MENTVFSEVRGNAIWDGIKEGIKMMIPFLAGLGIRQWFSDYQNALMWTAALVMAIGIAFYDQWKPIKKHVHQPLPIPNHNPKENTGRTPLVIESAFYGVNDTRSKPVEIPVFSDSVNIEVSSLPDHYHGELKRLLVNYTCGAVRRTVVRREYSQLMLPPDWEMWLQATADVLVYDLGPLIGSYEALRDTGTIASAKPLRIPVAGDPVGLTSEQRQLQRNKQDLLRISVHATRAWSKVEVNTNYYRLPVWNDDSSIEELIKTLRDFRSMLLWMFYGGVAP